MVTLMATVMGSDAGGLVNVMVVLFTTLIDGSVRLPMVTTASLVKPSPLIVTLVPPVIGPLAEARRDLEGGWIVKSDDIEPRLEKFKSDYEGYKNKTIPFKVYE